MTVNMLAAGQCRVHPSVRFYCCCQSMILSALKFSYCYVEGATCLLYMILMMSLIVLPLDITFVLNVSTIRVVSHHSV